MSSLRVVSITEFDKKKRKVLLEGDLVLALYPGDVKRFRLEEGAAVSRETLSELMGLLAGRARERALHLLEYSDKTEAKLRDRLRREGYPEEAVEAALKMVLRFGYVNDEAYGQRYVQANAGRKSRKQLVSGLVQKGLSRELAEELLREQAVDEEGQIRSLLEKKGYLGRKLDQREWQRAAGMLARRGYSFDAVSRVLEEQRDRGQDGRDFDGA